MPQRQERLGFEYDVVPDDGSVTAYGGLPLVAESLRALGASSAVREHVHIAERTRKHDEASLVEALVMLMAAGGDCLDDLEMLRADKALSRLLEREIPSAETARKFLYAFHDDALMQTAVEKARAAGEASYVPEESEPLQGLGKAMVTLVQSVAARGHGTMATVDVDATIQESHKREAKEHYEGGRGYQPVTAYWVEQDLVLADEFRDGNVPAGKDTLRIVQRAFAALPTTITKRRLRADSALYNAETLKWLSSEGVEFTVSADMGKRLREICESVPEPGWSLLETRGDEQVHVGEVEFFPGNWPKYSAVVRYLVMRMTPTQGRLFDEGRGPKYLAVVTNRAGEAAELVRWHWEKAGTVEHVHDVVKNELGGGVLPCGRFGANAAWYRLALLTYNVLSALKSIGLRPDLHDARPKRLRFHILVIPAVVVSHARQILARVLDRLQRAHELVAARTQLWALAPS